MSEEVTETEGTEEEGNSTITSLEDALKELAKTRREAAARRTKVRSLEEKAAKYDELVSSQKTEFEKLSEQHSTTSRENESLKFEKMQLQAALKVGLDPDLAPLLQGENLEQMVKLAEKLVSAKPAGSTDFYAGQRGKPVQANSTSPNDWFREAWKNSNK